MFALWIPLMAKKLVQTRVQDQDIKKSKVVVDFNSMMEGVDMSDT
jgi:hypothetical protein